MKPDFKTRRTYIFLRYYRQLESRAEREQAMGSGRLKTVSCRRGNATTMEFVITVRRCGS